MNIFFTTSDNEGSITKSNSLLKQIENIWKYKKNYMNLMHKQSSDFIFCSILGSDLSTGTLVNVIVILKPTILSVYILIRISDHLKFAERT